MQKRKLFLFAFCILLIIGLIIICLRNSMPQIIFTYCEYNYKSQEIEKDHIFDAWAIDRDGNVYHSYDQLVDFKQRTGDYRKVGSINPVEAFEKYLKVKRMLISDRYQLDEDRYILWDCTYKGSKHWCAYGYKDGIETKVDLYHETNVQYFNENPEADILADWIISVIQCYDEYSPVLYLEDE